MQILLFTTLYPNASMPHHGVFVENRLRAFLNKHDADIRVVAPVPWFPFQNDIFGHYARWARVPKIEQRHGVQVVHPRYFIPPKIGMTLAPTALARCLENTLGEWANDGWEPDLIDAHYFYPDGVAAAEIARKFDLPLVVTARGTDVNFIPRYETPRSKILNAAMQADSVITVAQALKDELVRLRVPPSKISVLRNGVDLDLFRPFDRKKLRKDMNLEGPVIASVGHLIERKGHHIAIEALSLVPNATFLIAGEGEERAALEKQVRDLKIASRVRFLGAIPHEKLFEIYNAADVLVLASSREGWPNVLLEAMACGTPCVATNAWGNGEVIGDPVAGLTVKDRTPKAFAEAINSLLAAPPARVETRAYAEHFSWDDTAQKMEQIFSRVSARASQRKTIKTTPVKITKPCNKPKLLITVDTEEMFDWRDFSATEHQCAPPKDINRFQALCADHQAKPLYFITYPLLKDAPSAEYFKALADNNAADCGLHLHQWVTPASQGDQTETTFTGEYFSYQKNLPLDVHQQKLQSLSDAFFDIFNKRAISHRAGRYGIAPENYTLLGEIGVTHDFSPSTSFNFSQSGGPDFSGVNNAPYAVHVGDTSIFVTPVSGARMVPKANLFLPAPSSPPGFARPRRGLKEKMTIPVRLSPEGAELSDLKALTRQLIKDGVPVLTFTLHSTSLTNGANAYGQTAEDVDQLLKTTDDYLRWYRQSIGGEIISLDQLDKLYQG